MSEHTAMWLHDCPVCGPTETEAGEPCPWCDAAELLARGDIPADYEKVGVDVSVPTKDEFRNAWSWDGTGIVHDMTKAADIRRTQLRIERASILAVLDVDYQRADEVGDAAAKAAIAAKKQVLRDITEDPRIDAAKTLDDLRTVKLP